jgi:hypothetical protein
MANKKIQEDNEDQNIHIDFQPNPTQWSALNTPATEIMYGGAKG